MNNLLKYKKSEYNKYYNIFIIIILIDLLIGSTDLVDGLWIKTEFYLYKYFLIGAILLLSLFIILLEKKTINFDKFFILLSFRACYLVILSLVYQEKFPNSWMICSVIQLIVPLIYLICINVKFREDKDYFENIALIASIVISIQIIYCFINAYFINPVEWYVVKSMINIPIGKNNYIGAILLILHIYYVLSAKPLVLKKILSIVQLVALFLTLSDAIYGLIFIFYIYYLFVYNRKRIIGKLHINNSIKFKPILNFTLICLVTVFLLKNYSTIINDFIARFLSNTIEAGSIINVFHGRFEIYSYSFKLLEKNFLFGYGLGNGFDAAETTRSHNIILQLLVSGGIINLSIFTYIIYKVIKYSKLLIKYYNKGKFVRIVLVFTLIDSLVEPTIQTYSYDIYFFLLISFLINRYLNEHYKLEKEIGDICD